MSWRKHVSAGVLSLCMLAAGAAGAQTGAQAGAKADAKAVEPAFLIGPEDILEISVWKEEGLKKDVLVRPDGGLSFPLVGDLQAAGRSVEEVRLEIARRLEKFIPDPVVSVLLQRVTSNKIYVIGRVLKPGEFAAGRYVDVLQALSMAGGLTTFADEKDVKVLRRENGAQRVYPFDFKAVSRGEKLQQNIRLQGGDVVVVP